MDTLPTDKELVGQRRRQVNITVSRMRGTSSRNSHVNRDTSMELTSSSMGREHYSVRNAHTSSLEHRVSGSTSFPAAPAVVQLPHLTSVHSRLETVHQATGMDTFHSRTCVSEADTLIHTSFMLLAAEAWPSPPSVESPGQARVGWDRRYISAWAT